MTMTRVASWRLGMLSVNAAIMLGLAGCSDADRPYAEIEGGGFIFNYRVAEAYYGVSVRPLRQLAPGTVIEAVFEDPAGGAPIEVRTTVENPRLSYALRTPGLTGIKAGQPYRVEVRVIAAGTAQRLATLETRFKSDLDQSMIPSAPLTVGPRYAPGPGVPR
jgi:hypothetical protein